MYLKKLFIVIILKCIIVTLIQNDVVFTQKMVNMKYSLDYYLKKVQKNSIGKSEDSLKIIFLLRFVDFGCEICLTTFLDFCDKLKAEITIYGKRDVILMFLEDNNPEAYQLRTLKRWAKASNLSYPIMLVPQSLFDDYNIEYSSILILNSDNIPEMSEKLPLSPETARLFMKKIFK
ncbi:MAG: hypothetical protein QME52_13320 [Bacteroidota bacterium]|nr:hypothetical protein [Bacteroidota bacterium]